MTAPRQLLGWTVPEHITFSYKPGTGVGMFITCPKHAFGPLRENYLYPLEGDLRVGSFLERHAHGESVGRVEGVLPETPEPPAKIFAPWNSETALTLIDFQQVGHLHPFTCPRDHGGQFALVANNGGWFCPADKCDYTQNWAWAFMADRSAWPDSPIWPIPAPQSSPAPLLPLSVPVETEGEAEGDTEALSPQVETELKLWNLLDQAEQEYLGSDEPCDRKSALVRAVLAEGWRPSRTPVPSSQVHVELAKTIAESAGIPQSLAATVASVLIEDEGWRPPLPPLSKVAPFDPDDETPAALAAFFLTPWFDGHARLAAGAARGLDVLGVLTQPVTPLSAVEPALLRRLSALFASTGRQHPAAWLADAATAAEERREWPVLPDKPRYNLVDVYGPNGELLYAGRLKAREDGGWDATPDGALPADEDERAKVVDFCAERSGFITSINNCHPDNERDYYRWQGHAEARRQLSERLGLPTAWPSGYPGVAVPVEPKETP